MLGNIFYVTLIFYEVYLYFQKKYKGWNHLIFLQISLMSDLIEGGLILLFHSVSHFCSY